MKRHRAKFPFDRYWVSKTYKTKEVHRAKTKEVHSIPYPSISSMPITPPISFHAFLSFLNHLILSHPVWSLSVPYHLFNPTPCHLNAPHPELQPISLHLIIIIIIIVLLLIIDWWLSWPKMSARGGGGWGYLRNFWVGICCWDPGTL